MFDYSFCILFKLLFLGVHVVVLHCLSHYTSILLLRYSVSAIFCYNDILLLRTDRVSGDPVGRQVHQTNLHRLPTHGTL